MDIKQNKTEQAIARVEAEFKSRPNDILFFKSTVQI
jgi:hypothetical protein